VYGQFFYQLIKDVEKGFGDALDKGERQLVDIVVQCLQKRARRRATEALVNGMSAQKRYHFDAEYRHAIDLFVNIVVAAAFGDLPTGVEPSVLASDFEKLMGIAKPKLQGQAVFAKWLDEGVKIPQEIGPEMAAELQQSWLNSSKIKESKPVTWADIEKAAEQIKAAPASGLAGTKTGRYSVKEPSPEVPPDKVMAELLKLAQDNARRLEQEQMAEEMGLATEEAKKKYPGVFGHNVTLKNGDSWEATYTMTFDSD